MAAGISLSQIFSNSVLSALTGEGWQGGGGLQEVMWRCYPVAMELAEVTCPTCFEVFEVAVPHPDEMPAEVDYDCEICCRPMMIVFTENEVYAKGLGE
jgi:hypothetical protein